MGLGVKPQGADWERSARMSISTKQRLYESILTMIAGFLDEVVYEACSPRGTCDVMGL